MGKWLEILKDLGPVIVRFIPGLDPKFGPLIVAAIGEAEQLAGATGDDKKRHALGLVKVGAEATNAATSSARVDVPKLTDAASKAIDAVVQGVNAVRTEVVLPKLRTE